MTARAALLGAIALAFAACAHAPADVPATAAAPAAKAANPGAANVGAPRPEAPDPAAAARLATLRRDVDRLLAAEASLLWDAWTRGASPDPAALSRQDAVFTPDAIAFVRAQRDQAQGDERRALSLLHAFLLGERVGRDSGRGAERPPAGVFTWDGRPVAAASAPRLLASERDPARREAIERAWLAAEQRRAPVVAARWQRVAAAAARLGYPSLPALAAELRAESPDALARLAEDVLATTGTAYRTLLDALAQQELGRSLSDVRGRDLPLLFRAGEDARSFPASRLASDARSPFVALGLPLDGRPGVIVDAGERDGKDPRAIALPVEVPGSVRIAYTPAAGAGELRALLHELGAAAFYAHVTSPVMEFRRLGPSTAETWANLFRDLAGNPAWLAERTALDEAHLAPFVRAAAGRRLHEARTWAARVLVEVARARDPGFGGDAARQLLERAFARPVDAAELQLFLLDRDPLLDSADALRPALLAAQAEAFLSRNRSGSWWTAPDCGNWLRRAFSEGSRLAPADLGRVLGGEGVDPRALAASAAARASSTGLRVAGAVGG